VTDDKIDNVKDSFYEELEHIFNKFPKYHMKMLLGDFNVEVGREDIFKQQLGIKFYMKILTIMQLPAYADNVNLLGDNINTIKKDIQPLIDASKEVDLKVKVEKTECMLVSHHQSAGLNWKIKKSKQII
jgi:hypothetical protein